MLITWAFQTMILKFKATPYLTNNKQQDRATLKGARCLNRISLLANFAGLPTQLAAKAFIR